MLKVKIISGTYGYNNGKRIEPKDSMSKPFLLADEEAERLAELGVAKIITESVATGGNGAEINPPSVNPSNGKKGSNGENESDNAKSGHVYAEQLNGMTLSDLKKLAEKMGIDTAKFKRKDRKGEYIDAIAAVEVTTDDDDGEQPPALGAEAPVV